MITNCFKLFSLLQLYNYIAPASLNISTDWFVDNQIVADGAEFHISPCTYFGHYFYATLVVGLGFVFARSFFFVGDVVFRSSVFYL